ncbi:PAS domain-containing sensor histidine kinase [Marinilabilia rubra]|nr:PAS domain S-box protein [Marinilabilia rubra]
MHIIFLLSTHEKTTDLISHYAVETGSLCFAISNSQQLITNLKYTKPDILIIDQDHIKEGLNVVYDKTIQDRPAFKTIIFNKNGIKHEPLKKDVIECKTLEEVFQNINNNLSPAHQITLDQQFYSEKNNILDSFLEALPEPAAISDLTKGRFIKVNSKFLEVTGFTKEEVINRSSLDINFWVNKEDRTFFIKQIKKDHTISPLRTHFYNKKKEVIDCHISATLFTDSSGQFVLSILDNTIRNKILEEKLFETQLIARVGSYTLDFKTGLWSSSRVLNQIFGISGDYKKTIDSWLKIVHPQWQQTMKKHLEERILNKKQEFDKQYKIVTINDKTEKWVHGRGSLIYNEDGALEKMVGTVIDITNYKNIEFKLEKKQKLLDNIIRTSPVGIVLSNKNGDIYYANKRGREILNLSLNEGIPIRYNAPEWQITDLDGGFYPEEELPFNLVKKHLKPVYGIKHAIQDSQGHRKVLSINAAPIDTEEEKFNGMIATIEDITLQVSYEKKMQDHNQTLQELVSVKNKFFSIIGHDLRSPIGSLKQLSNLLNSENETLNQDDRSNILRHIEIVSEEAFQLIENLLEWSRLERGLSKPKIKPVCSEDLINHAIDLHKSIANKKQVIIEKEIDSSHYIECDEEMTKTILRNLISNAIKFSFQGSVIKLITRDKNHYIEITVKDQGTGIPPNKQKNLFNHSFNKSNPGTNGETGTGLGLSLCKELTEIQGGDIYLKETSKNGSSMAFKLKKSTKHSKS